MKITLLILILFYTTLSFGQKVKSNRFHFGAQLFSNFTFDQVFSNTKLPKSFRHSINTLERGKISYNSEIFVEYSFNFKMSLITGVGIHNVGYVYKKSKIINSSGNSGNPIYAKSIYNIHNLEIPLLFKYNLKHPFYLIVGGSFIYYNNVTIKNILYYSDKPRSASRISFYSSGFRTTNYYINLGFGYNHSLANGFTFYIQPYIQYGIYGIYKNNTINNRMIPTGLVLGIKF